MRLSLIDKWQRTPDVISFIFRPESPITWKAGQFLHYFLKHENPDSRKEDRWFTISSAPFEKNVMITTRFTEGTGSSFKKALRNLNVGNTIEATGPEGDFVVNDPGKHYVFIAGGIGITPFRSILMQLDYEGHKFNVDLLYANRDEQYVFDSEFQELMKKQPNFRIHKFTSPKKIEESDIRSAAQNLNEPIYYISGPEPMVEHYKELLKNMGIAEDHIVGDFFPGYSVI